MEIFPIFPKVYSGFIFSYLCIIDEENDQVADKLLGDITIIMSHRYTFQSIVPKADKWFQDVLLFLDEERCKQMMRVTRH